MALVFYHGEYDVAGRKVVQSEPYAVASAAITATYTTPIAAQQHPIDAYGRVSAQGLATGKSITTTYSRGDPTTVVYDGYQEVSTTLDARGKIAQPPTPTAPLSIPTTPQANSWKAIMMAMWCATDGWGREKPFRPFRWRFFL